MKVDGKYRVTLDLESVEDNIVIEASDFAQNKTIGKYTVRIQNDSPFIKVLTDVNKIYFDENLTLELEVVDDDLKEFMVNEKVVNVVDGKAEIGILLSQALNDFNILAVDKAGNETKKLINIKRELDFYFALDNYNYMKNKIYFDSYKINGKVDKGSKIILIDKDGYEEVKVENVENEDGRFNFYVKEDIVSVKAINSRNKVIEVPVNMQINREAKFYIEESLVKNRYYMDMEDEIEIRVMARNLEDVKLINFDIEYDSKILEVKLLDGDIIKFEEESILDKAESRVVGIPGKILNEGKIKGSAICIIGDKSVSGDGAVARIRFVKKQKGSSKIILSNVRVINREGDNVLLEDNGFGEVNIK